ncbi:histone-lysine N-methyltransferase SETMAR-like [Achlya hypogyna]|uniref:Histone-lysine N-methyltransferase SETMAR-like n=1 Tax=Achlya hypogyna TaxID=1202772 RepID=A0A1V9YMC9_ACHHY|nr:histone-lysine N-methyltransferase SETMAR-like [Achlya hypogyna]
MKRPRPAPPSVWDLAIFDALDVKSLYSAALVSRAWASRVRRLHAARRADLSRGQELLPVTVRSTGSYPCDFDYRASTRLPSGHDWPSDVRRSVAVYIARAAAKGWALFAGEAIPAGTFLGEYAGRLVRTISMNRASSYIVSVREEGASAVFRLNVDAMRLGSCSRFINHSCEPNAVLDTYRRQDMLCVLPRVHIISLRAIAAEEEITIDYGVANGVGRETCHCGTSACLERLPFDASL